MGTGEKNWNPRDPHPQGHLNAFSSLGVPGPWVWMSPRWLSCDSRKPSWARERLLERPPEGNGAPYTTPGTSLPLCLRECGSFRGSERERGKERRGTGTLCVTLYVSDKAVCLGQSVYVASIFVHVWVPPVPTPGRSALFTPGPLERQGRT